MAAHVGQAVVDARRRGGWADRVGAVEPRVSAVGSGSSLAVGLCQQRGSDVPASGAHAPQLSSSHATAAWNLPIFRTRLAKMRPAPDGTVLDLLYPVDPARIRDAYGDAMLAGTGSSLFLLTGPDNSCGLRNLHQTCFISSLVQIMCRIRPLLSRCIAHAREHALFCGEACGMCAMAAQCAVVHGAGGVDCPIAVLARTGYFGTCFASGHQMDCGCSGCRPRASDGNDVRNSSGAVVLDLQTGQPGDASSFMVSLLRILGEPDRQWMAAQLAGRGHDEWSFFDETIFGCVIRNRSYCCKCKRVLDSLQGSSQVSLDVCERVSAVRLQSLWEVHFSSMQSTASCAGAVEAPCDGRLEWQRFLEKEPPVLCIVLRRGMQERNASGRIVREWKVCTPVTCPRSIQFLRSGVYDFAGAVLHEGTRCDRGHYTAVCRVGQDEYAE